MSKPEKDLPEAFDLVIIGTGLYGIQAARYYLDVHPDAEVLLLESDDVVGGTWSSKRMYPDFWTQTPVKMAEFSDRPMSPPPEEDQYYGFFPGKYTTPYLESYVDNHIYSGRTIRDRIRFQCTVDNITRFRPTASTKPTSPVIHWKITCNNATHELHTSKLIDATGMTSNPNIPSLPTTGSSKFKGPILHHKTFGQPQTQDLLLQDPSIKNICILGGAKSAADVAYACAKAPTGKNVHWIIREDGNGPCAFFAVQSMSERYANSNEGFYNRFLASYLPNRFGGQRWGWVKWALQGTGWGRWYVKKLWDGFDMGLRGMMDYGREDGKANGFADLEYDTPIFWQNDSSGVNTRADFLDVIAKKVHVYRRNVSHLSEDTITLQPRSNGADGRSEDKEPVTIPIDVLVYCTGWSTTTTLFPPDEASKLGISVPIQDADPHTQAHWEALEAAADPTVLARFPALRHPPAYRKIEAQQTPFRLYKAIAPPADDTHSIAFLGKLVVGNNFRVAEAQALWAVAYLDGRIRNLPSQAQMEKEVAETVAWDRRRYLNKGELGSWFYFDVVDYADALLEELRLDSHKQKGPVGNLMDPCFAADLKELGEEYKRKYET